MKTERVLNPDIDPGPWGICVNSRGVLEANFSKVKGLVDRGSSTIVIFSNGEHLVLPPEIKQINVDQSSGGVYL